MLSPHFFHAGMGICSLLYPSIAACCLLMTIRRILRKKEAASDHGIPPRIFIPAIAGAYSLACFLLLMWIARYNSTGIGFDTTQPILANERIAILIFNTVGITITLAFCAALIHGLRTKKLRCRLVGKFTLAILITFPIIYYTVQDPGLLRFKLVSPETILQDWPESDHYQFFFIQDGVIWNQSLDGQAELKLEPDWAFSPWTRIEFSNYDMNNGFASVYSTSMRNSKPIDLPLRIQAKEIGLFAVGTTNYQSPVVCAAKLATNLNAERLGSHGGILRYETAPGIFQTIHTYNAAHITDYPPNRDQFASRLEITYCTRLGDAHFLFSLGSREIYLLDVSSNQIAKLTDGYSPLVYIAN